MTSASDVLMDITENLVIAEMRKEWEDYEAREGGRSGDELMWNLFQAGEWITWKMKQHGAAEQETKDQSFVIGQRMWPNHDPFPIAADVFDRWLKGRGDRPGRELGERLGDKALKDLGL